MDTEKEKKILCDSYRQKSFGRFFRFAIWIRNENTEYHRERLFNDNHPFPFRYLSQEKCTTSGIRRTKSLRNGISGESTESSGLKNTIFLMIFRSNQRSRMGNFVWRDCTVLIIQFESINEDKNPNQSIVSGPQPVRPSSVLEMVKK